MTHMQLGDKDQARRSYEQALEWEEKHKANDEDLRRFRSEAAEILGVEERKR